MFIYLWLVDIFRNITFIQVAISKVYTLASWLFNDVINKWAHAFEVQMTSFIENKKCDWFCLRCCFIYDKKFALLYNTCCSKKLDNSRWFSIIWCEWNGQIYLVFDFYFKKDDMPLLSWALLLFSDFNQFTVCIVQFAMKCSGVSNSIFGVYDINNKQLLYNCSKGIHALKL